MLSPARSEAATLPLLSMPGRRSAKSAGCPQTFMPASSEKACWCLAAVAALLALALVCAWLAALQFRDERDQAVLGFIGLRTAAMDAADRAAEASSLFDSRSKLVNAMLAEAAAADGRIDHLQWKVAAAGKQQEEIVRENQREIQAWSAHSARLASQIEAAAADRAAERRQNESSLAAASEDLASASRSLEEARRFAGWAEKRIKELECFAMGLRCRISELESEGSRLITERDSAIRERDTAISSHESCEREIESLDSCIRALRSELQQCRAHAASQRSR